MSEPTLEAVRAALSKIIDPAQGKDIISTGQVQGLGVNGERVSFILEVDPNRGSAMEPLRKAAEEAVKSVPGIVAVNVVMTAHSGEGQAKPAAAAPKSAPPGFPIKAPKPLEGASKRVPGVDRIIAIASGKGGVGKSTVSSNLAVALAAQGKRVGLLDADVYGPSQPRMLGVSGRPSSPDGHIILPLRNHGVTLMSIGLMTGEDEAVVWRGPMLMGALQQMLTQVQWGRLDVLLVDLPPGTGDVQMTLCQKAEVDGVVIVSTPQDIALIDARKGIDMFQKMNTPILGIIENMSSFVCTTCQTVHHPFGHGGAKAEAEKLGVPFLGEIPLDLDIRIASDGGAPIVAAKPDSPQTKAFWDVAENLMKSDAMK
ncbi:Mrp/NBP35 family ATP-binding protein [Pararhizobium sp. IMCC21322]|uniref:Mrp/NBP35 family ATP-binding protein n=1 Tax=Pararhizobium sp. IMCC21322 TaxID=3067903 RepID=UPI0027418D2A|nr:Mrp/NBP35 family ATP-binding protein [Pararhizobium sp. IMCC21322]